MKTKSIKVLHDAKAAIWTRAGLHLQKITEHPKIIDRILLQNGQTITYTNEFEQNYYGAGQQFTFVHPATHLHVLRDVWVVGSEGHVFFEPDQLFTICSSFKGIAERKIRRPIPCLAQEIEEPVFVLSSRAPGNRGHFMIEHLPRLVASLAAIKQLGGCKFLVTPGHRKWQLPYLRKLDIPDSEIIEAGIGSTFCKKALYVPTLCEGDIATVSCESYYQFLRNRFLAGVPSGRKGAAIFLSRQDAPDRKLANEDAIFSLAKTFFPKIERVMLSALSFDEQILLFEKAAVIIGPHSQSFRHVLFSSNALVIQLIQGYRTSTNEYYQWAQNYNYIGNIGGNSCLPLFSEIAFHTNSDWIYPEDKFAKDMSNVLSLSNKEKSGRYEV